mgnify:CR=1 FL=1
MMQEKLKEIRDLLTEVKYPGTSKNIVELDMVQNIRIEGEKVLFRLVFQKASVCRVGEEKSGSPDKRKNFLYGGRDRKPVCSGFGETVVPGKGKKYNRCFLG